MGRELYTEGEVFEERSFHVSPFGEQGAALGDEYGPGAACSWRGNEGEGSVLVWSLLLLVLAMAGALVWKYIQVPGVVG